MALFKVVFKEGLYKFATTFDALASDLLTCLSSKLKGLRLNVSELFTSVLLSFLSKYAISFTTIDMGFKISTPKKDKAAKLLLFSLLSSCCFVLEDLNTANALLITLT